MCGRVDELIREWERTGRLSPAELVQVSEHLRQCRRCAAAHGALLPLLRRDAGVPSGLTAAAGPLPESFTEGLMGRLSAGSLPGGDAAGRRRFASWRSGRTVLVPLALAIGAAVLVAAGFLGWFLGLRPRGQEVLVRFELVAPEAQSVHLVGDFNGWDAQGLAMKDVSGEGDWQITVRLEKGRAYTYNFLLDGRQWIADPGSLRQVADGFGGTNSVLEL